MRNPLPASGAHGHPAKPQAYWVRVDGTLSLIKHVSHNNATLTDGLTKDNKIFVTCQDSYHLTLGAKPVYLRSWPRDPPTPL
jgi:hypothetical protein